MTTPPPPVPSPPLHKREDHNDDDDGSTILSAISHSVDESQSDDYSSILTPDDSTEFHGTAPSTTESGSQRHSFWESGTTISSELQPSECGTEGQSEREDDPRCSRVPRRTTFPRARDPWSRRDDYFEREHIRDRLPRHSTWGQPTGTSGPHGTSQPPRYPDGGHRWSWQPGVPFASKPFYNPPPYPAFTPPQPVFALPNTMYGWAPPQYSEGYDPRCSPPYYGSMYEPSVPEEGHAPRPTAEPARTARRPPRPSRSASVCSRNDTTRSVRSDPSAVSAASGTAASHAVRMPAPTAEVQEEPNSNHERSNSVFSESDLTRSANLQRDIARAVADIARNLRLSMSKTDN